MINNRCFRFIPINQRFVLKIYLVLAAYQYYDLASSIIQQICTYLNIGCLYIKKKPEEKTN